MGAHRHLTLSVLERDFLRAAGHLSRRRARRARLVAGSLAVLLSVSLLAGLLALRQKADADEQRDLALRHGRTVAAQRDQAEALRIAALAGQLAAVDPPSRCC